MNPHCVIGSGVSKPWLNRDEDDLLPLCGVFLSVFVLRAVISY